MRRNFTIFALLAAVVAACGPQTPQTTATPTPSSGAATPRDAIDGFMAAIKAEDLQALSMVWGNEKGPARDAFERQNLERRELLLICYFKHDSYRITSERSQTDGKQNFVVEIRKGTLIASPLFTTVKGPNNRWYVENAEILQMQAFCMQR